MLDARNVTRVHSVIPSWKPVNLALQGRSLMIMALATVTIAIEVNLPLTKKEQMNVPSVFRGLMQTVLVKPSALRAMLDSMVTLMGLLADLIVTNACQELIVLLSAVTLLQIAETVPLVLLVVSMVPVQRIRVNCAPQARTDLTRVPVVIQLVLPVHQVNSLGKDRNRVRHAREVPTVPTVERKMSVIRAEVVHTSRLQECIPAIFARGGTTVSSALRK